MHDLFEKNPFLERVSAGKTPMGFFSYLRSTAVLDITGTIGSDFVVVDSECTGMERETTKELILAVEPNQVVPFVRVLELIPYLMGDYMKVDTHGILVPHIRSGTECGVAQEALRYPPYGNVSCCRSNHADGLEAKSWTKCLDHVQELVFAPMIEDPEAIGHLDEVLDELKSGQDMVMFGKADYGQACGSLNADGIFTSEVNEAYLKAMERCRARNIGFMACPSTGPAGQMTAGMKKMIEEGCSVMVLNADQLMLAAAFGNTVGPCLALGIKK